VKKSGISGYPLNFAVTIKFSGSPALIPAVILTKGGKNNAQHDRIGYNDLYFKNNTGITKSGPPAKPGDYQWI